MPLEVAPAVAVVPHRGRRDTGSTTQAASVAETSLATGLTTGLTTTLATAPLRPARSAPVRASAPPRRVPVAPPPPPPSPEPAPTSAAGPEDAEEAARSRVGLFFDDGSHVLLDPTDPRAEAFAALADKLNG